MLKNLMEAFLVQSKSLDSENEILVGLRNITKIYINLEPIGILIKKRWPFVLTYF